MYARTDGRMFVKNAAGEAVSVGQMVKSTLEAGVTLTIPAGYQFNVMGDYTIDGTLVIDGEFGIL
jgi:hypothetical protein